MSQFNRAYLLQEAATFRTWMGQHDFWQGNKPRQAMLGLLYTYLHTPDTLPKDEDMIQALFVEYDQRLILCLQHGIYQPNLEYQNADNFS